MVPLHQRHTNQLSEDTEIHIRGKEKQQLSRAWYFHHKTWLQLDYSSRRSSKPNLVKTAAVVYS